VSHSFPGSLRPDRVVGGSALGSERVGFRLVLGESVSFRLVACRLPPSRGTAVERLVLTRRVFHSFGSSESVLRSLHRHHLLSLFDFADGLFVDGDDLFGPPFSAVQAEDTLRAISNASSGVWTDPRMAFSTRSSERAN